MFKGLILLTINLSIKMYKTHIYDLGLVNF